MSNVHVLLMAAGASIRMGTPKQLLPWGDTTIIEHQLSVLQQVNLPITIVLGAHSEAILQKIDFKELNVIVNPNWKEGLGTSIAFGVKEIQKTFPKTEGIIIALVDQPFIEASHYVNLITSIQSDKKQIIVSISEDGNWMPPVLFDANYFHELQNLKGDKGAMKMIQNHKECVTTIPCKTSLQDLDTMEDYSKFQPDH